MTKKIIMQEREILVEELLRQYKEYLDATSQAEKDRIGDAMTYADPVVWMMYKHQAYAESDHPVRTLGELRTHSIDHGGICAKRFYFLRQHIIDFCGKDILNDHIFPDDIWLADFMLSPEVRFVVEQEDLMHQWAEYEYFRVGERVAKWENYRIDSDAINTHHHHGHS